MGVFVSGGWCRYRGIGLGDLPATLIALAFSFTTVADFFALVRCARVFRHVAQSAASVSASEQAKQPLGRSRPTDEAALRAVSPKFLRVPLLASTPDSFARMRPLAVEIAESPVIDVLARLRGSASTLFSATRHLSLDLSWHFTDAAPTADKDPNDYAAVARLVSLTSLRLRLNRWGNGAWEIAAALGDRLLELTLAYPPLAGLDVNYDFMVRLGALTALRLENAPLSYAHTGALRALGQHAPALRSLHLAIARTPHLTRATRLDFLTALVALRSLTLDASALAEVDSQLWTALPVLPLLERLDLARSGMSLSVLGERGGIVPSTTTTTTVTDSNAWRSLTYLVAPTEFSCDELSALPQSLVCLDVSGSTFIDGEFLDQLLPLLPAEFATADPARPKRVGGDDGDETNATTETKRECQGNGTPLPLLPSTSSLLPERLHRVILPHKCSVIDQCAGRLLWDFLWLRARADACGGGGGGGEKSEDARPRVAIEFASRTRRVPPS